MFIIIYRRTRLHSFLRLLYTLERTLLVSAGAQTARRGLRRRVLYGTPYAVRRLRAYSHLSLSLVSIYIVHTE